MPGLPWKVAPTSISFTTMQNYKESLDSSSGKNLSHSNGGIHPANHWDKNYSSEIVDVTPEIAERFLENHRCGRRQGLRYIRALSESMKSGDYHFTSVPLIFCPDPDNPGYEVLGDGQHRCSAIVLSGVTIRCVINHGVPLEALRYIDSNRPRTAADLSLIYGREYKNVNSLMCAARMLWFLERRDHQHGSKVQNYQVLETVERHPELQDWVNEALSDSRAPAIGGLPGALYFINTSGDPRAEQFARFVYKGYAALSENPKLRDESNAAFELHDWLIERKEDLRYGRSKALVAFQTLKAWDYYICGKSSKHFRMPKPTAENVPWPVGATFVPKEESSLQLV